MESAVANEWDAIKVLFEAFEAYFQNNDCEVILTQLIIPGLFEPPVRTLRATCPENESHIFR